MPNVKPRMLVIGSRGFLGRYSARTAAATFDVIGGNRTRGMAHDLELDIRNENSVKAAFEIADPDAVLLLAAYSDVDYCELHPEEALAVNLNGAEHVAEACQRNNARLLFTSTGAVFDGRQHGYTESDPLSPVSVYGDTKARAEKLILSTLPDALVVRLPLVLGFSGHTGTNALLDNLKKRWTSGLSVAMPVFEQRNPIDAGTCSQFMLELVRNGERGIFHIGSQDPISRYDLGLKLATHMGYDDGVTPQLEPIPGRAPRGPDHFLLTDKLKSTSTIPIPTCDQVIERCFNGVA